MANLWGVCMTVINDIILVINLPGYEAGVCFGGIMAFIGVMLGIVLTPIKKSNFRKRR